MRHLLDTDHVSLIQRGTAEGGNIRRRMLETGLDDFGITIVSLEEQFRGWADRIHQARTSETRIKAYTELQNGLRFYSAIAVWGYNAAADDVFVTLESAKIRVGTKDMRIAAIAVANGATLLTRNTRDFERIPGLQIADWSIQPPATP